MRRFLRACSVCAGLLLALLPLSAQAGVKVEVDVESQTMDVYVNGRLKHSWPVSTGRRGYETPGGTYSVKRMEEEWYSKQYDDAPMPHAIFFASGYAIHGSYETRRLGRPASHGCVRLAPRNAAKLYNLVASYGPKSTRISIND